MKHMARLAAGLMVALCAVWMLGAALAETLAEGDFEYRVDGDACVIVSYTGSDPNIVIPARLGGYPVREIMLAQIGSSDDHIDSVKIEDGIQSIGFWAFGNYSLDRLSIPASVVSIDEWGISGDNRAFTLHVQPGSYAESYAKTHGLRYTYSSLEAPEVKEEYVYAVDAYTDLFYEICGDTCVITGVDDRSGEIIVPAEIEGRTVTTIGLAAFEYAYVSNIVIPDTVTVIGDNAFCGIERITSMVIPEGVTHIGREAFANCRGMTDILLPDTLVYMGMTAFSICENLRSIELPDGITSIGEYGFADCNSLMSIKLPKELKTIGGLAFSNCGSLTQMDLPDGVTDIGYLAFSGCDHLARLYIPASVAEIAEDAFLGCDNLTIHTPAGSYAEAFALEHGIPCVNE